MDRKIQIKICLDEIESSLEYMEYKSISKGELSKHKGWIRKHKEILKELKYRGKMPRQKRMGV